MHPPIPHPIYISPRPLWTSKLVLRILLLIFDISLLALGGSISPASLAFIIVAPAGFLSLAWNFAEGVCILSRGGHRGIHPGANVALDLILWLGSTGVCVTLVDFGYSFSGSVSRSEFVTMGRGLIGIAAVLAALHFATFVIACYETHVRNRLAATRMVVVVQGGGQGGMVPVGGGFYGYPQQQVMYPMGMVGPGQQQHVSYYQPAAGMGYMPAMQMQQFEQPKAGEAQQVGQMPRAAPPS